MTARELTQAWSSNGQRAWYNPAGKQMWGGHFPVISNGDTQTYEAGLEPVANTDGSWTYTLPAVASPLSTRRIERIWSVDGRFCTYTRGDIVTFEAEFLGNLGAAAQSDDHWHVPWQLHGPGGTNLSSWRPPPMGLTIRNGKVKFEGGEGHPLNGYTKSTYYKWSLTLGDWVDNVRHHIRIQVRVDNDPDGWVSCWYDGTEVCHQWRPEGYWPLSDPGPTGNYPGTIYSTPDQAVGDWVQSRSGLYRGVANSAAAPTYAQSMRWWPVDVSPAHNPSPIQLAAAYPSESTYPSESKYPHA